MVRADHLTPEEAKARLVKLQTQIRDRQREFAKRKKAEGFRRINAFISPEAFEIIDRERKRTGDNTGDVLTTIIEHFDHNNKNLTDNDKPAKTKSTDQAGDRPAIDIITDLSADGMGPTAIANRLNDDGVPTLTGKGRWHKGTVSNILKQIKEVEK